MGRKVVDEAHEINLAVRLIHRGARLRVLESETSISHDRLSRLQREISGRASPKGMLPFSIDWFMPWTQNIHSTIFYSIYLSQVKATGVKGVESIITAYDLYREHDEVRRKKEPELSFTRAWTLVRFFNGGMVQMTPCSNCDLEFVTHAHELAESYQCPLCKPPPRIINSLREKKTELPGLGVI